MKVKAVEKDCFSSVRLRAYKLAVRQTFTLTSNNLQLANWNIYYDSGIKLELAIAGQRRSQFRIKSGNLTTLYANNEVINVDFTQFS